MYDTYYQTRVNRRWGRIPAGGALGVILILLGIAAIIFSAVDVSRTSIVGANPLKPLFVTGGPGQPNRIRDIATIFCDYSLWATLGKGIWVGLFFIVTGIVAICSQAERTSKSIAATTILATLSTIFAFYLMLSGIPQLQKYSVLGPNSTSRRSNKQNTEYVMNALLITVGVVASVIAFLLACLGCLADACNNARTSGPRGPLPPAAFGPTPFGRPRFVGPPPFGRAPPRFIPPRL